MMTLLQHTALHYSRPFKTLDLDIFRYKLFLNIWINC